MGVQELSTSTSSMMSGDVWRDQDTASEQVQAVALCYPGCLGGALCSSRALGNHAFRTRLDQAGAMPSSQVVSMLFCTTHTAQASCQPPCCLPWVPEGGLAELLWNSQLLACSCLEEKTSLCKCLPGAFHSCQG